MEFGKQVQLINLRLFYLPTANGNWIDSSQIPQRTYNSQFRRLGDRLKKGFGSIQLCLLYTATDLVSPTLIAKRM